jgi:hypothetical protein
MKQNGMRVQAELYPHPVRIPCTKGGMCQACSSYNTAFFLEWQGVIGRSRGNLPDHWLNKTNQ